MGVRATGALLFAFATMAASPVAATTRWVDSWGAAQMQATGQDALPPMPAKGLTLRQIVHLSRGGTALRVRISNAFGTTPLTIDAGHVARATAAGRAAIDPASDHALLFAGRPSATVPPGAEIYSDAVVQPVPPGGDLAISLAISGSAAGVTGHPGARATSFVVAGDAVAATDLPGAQAFPRWYHVADVEVATDEAEPAAVGAIGDSITDGHGATTDGNDRWPDRLAERLRADPTTAALGVVNAGIGGNHVLTDGIGPNLLARFDRDVIARTGVRGAIVLEGINDVGLVSRDRPDDAQAHAAMVRGVIDAFRQMVERAHAHGIRLIAGTITPFVGSDYYHPGPASEADRQAINAFIRTAGIFDGVVDFDRAIRDPAHPDRILPRFDSGDHLHPSPAGYRAMGDAVPLEMLAPASTQTPRIAITFDDIPAHGDLPPGTDRRQVIDGIIAALKARDVPAHGFLNAGFGKNDPRSPAVIAAWRRAGLPLGNHTYAHSALSKVGATVFLADVDRDEPVLGRAMQGADRHWLRYPFLDEGRDAAETATVRAGLRRRGYRIAGVTMSFGDFAWNGPYARCAARGDRGQVAALEVGYLAAARADAENHRALSQRLLGRDIPYVLLMHVGAFDAHMLPRLLDLYAGMGFRFVPLAEAERDPFYAAATDLALPGPSPSLDRLARARSIALPAAPSLPSQTLCS